MKNTNLFKHAPKELVTDAFLTWLFYFLDSDNKYQSHKQTFFNEFLLKKEDIDKPISDINIKLQEKVKDGRIDLLLEFKIENNLQKILFENKTWTTTSEDQLQKYKDGFPNLYKYIYLKLAYLNYQEKKLSKKLNYDYITSKDLSDILRPIANLHPFIDQYLEYINETFVNYINNFQKKIFEKKEYSILSDGQAQQYLMDILYKELDNERLDYLEFKQGSSSGNPWTELYIAKKDRIYGGTEEYLIWRIDKRRDKFCIRLNQYAYIKKENNKEYNIKKKERLKQLRQIALNINSKYNLQQGKLSDNGVNQNEVIVFFLQENDIEELIKKLIPSFSIDMVNEYNKGL